MQEFNKVIFICKENLSQSPMAEWIFKSIIMDTSKEITSRGMVVLFPEPLNQKVADVLTKHGIPFEHHVSVAFEEKDMTEDTLMITMTGQEKIKMVEDFGVQDNVYTLKEFVGEEDDVFDPYGGTEEDYETCYLEIKDLLYKMKEKLNWN